MSDISTVSAMFEEIKQYLKKLDAKTSEQKNTQPTSANGLDKVDITELKEVISHSEDKIISAIEGLKTCFRNEKRKTELIISLDPKSTPGALAITGLVMLLIIVLSLFYKQWEQNEKLKDNDLKYRYVSMKGEITTDKIDWLEGSFPNNKDSIKAKVLEYEDAVQKQSKAIKRKNLNDEEMKNLNQKIDKLKE
ncbi:hypothetical protein [Dysgonomonas sp. BGC7]|uniref:hypothetical protein n=1 Tax=Dysgonomonas sp. BGC7 TaxID=1658008 RepID=UPI0006801B09|nr:hypothetical protein [Dysgonomonas sp. BGC7]MBD8387934.1 hypothetical protein [Dysgonomonas sp. BGC7]